MTLLNCPEIPRLVGSEEILYTRDGNTYFKFEDKEIKINNQLSKEMRIIIGGVAIYMWYELMKTESPDYRIISYRIVGWQRWISGSVEWGKFNERCKEKTKEIIEKIRKKKVENSTVPPRQPPMKS